MKTKTKIFAVLLLMLMVTPWFASAAITVPCTSQAVKQASDFGQNPAAELPRCINQIYVWSLGIGALLGLFMTVLGGYYYMTAAGNAERSEKGVEMIWGSIIGLGLLFGAYLLLQTINPDLVNFQGFIKDTQGVIQPTSPASTPTQTPGPVPRGPNP